jgi:hypothetical protein
MISEKKLQCIRIYETGLHLYREKKFKSAIEKFEEALNYDPEDGPSKLFIERCNHFLITPVSDDWNGVYEMKTK